METYKLMNDRELPKIGFGTYKSADGHDKSVIAEALRQGYRLFDTAAFYENEEAIGEAVKESGLERSEIFLTSKVWKGNMGYRETVHAFEESLDKLQTDYLDLYLIHWPRPIEQPENWKEADLETWKAMEDLYKEGRIKAIGVSNFLPHHLMHLMENGTIYPMVNQIEFHPGYMQKAVLDFCREHGILVEAWSPLGRARVLQEPALLEMALRYGKSTAQICLRFALQCGVLPLPKSSGIERMKQNLEIFDFEIDKNDMSVLMTLPQIGWSGEHPDRDRVYFESKAE